MAIRVPGEFHEDKMRQHQAGPPPSQTRSIQAKPSQAKPSQAKPGQARSSRRHWNDTEGQNDYHLGKFTHAMPMHLAIIL